MTALLECLNQYVLEVFDAIYFDKFSCCTARKYVKFKQKSPYYSGIIPEFFYHQLFQKLFCTHAYLKAYNGVEMDLIHLDFQKHSITYHIVGY